MLSFCDLLICYQLLFCIINHPILVTLIPLRVLEGPKNITLDVSDDVNLNCLFFSEIPVTVKWLFNEQPIYFPYEMQTTENMSTLLLHNVNVSNTGDYLCQLDNGVERVINASGYVTVGEPCGGTEIKLRRDEHYPNSCSM